MIPSTKAMIAGIKVQEKEWTAMLAIQQKSSSEGAVAGKLA
jgi:hypothetical protein